MSFLWILSMMAKVVRRTSRIACASNTYEAHLSLEDFNWHESSLQEDAMPSRHTKLRMVVPQ